MFILGIVILLLGIFLQLVFKGISISIFLNPAAITMYITAIIAVLTATQSFNVFLNGLKAAASPKIFISGEDRGKAASLFRMLSKATAMASLIILIIGIITALAYMHTDDYSFEHALVASLSGVIIGLFLIIAVFEPAVIILKKRKDN